MEKRIMEIYMGFGADITLYSIDDFIEKLSQETDKVYFFIKRELKDEIMLEEYDNLKSDEIEPYIKKLFTEDIIEQFCNYSQKRGDEVFYILTDSIKNENGVFIDYRKIKKIFENLD